MSQEEKEAYQVEAVHQQSKIDELAQKPMLVGKDRSRSQEDDREKSVWSKAKRKISARRLQLNQDAFRSHEVWRLPTQLGDSALASISCHIFEIRSYSAFFAILIKYGQHSL